MEDTDVSSHCSEVSQNSELSVTSISGLSIYQNEFLELKQNVALVKLASTNSSNVHSSCEERINFLTKHLQEVSLVGEKYKKDIFDLEKKVELSFHSRIEAVIKHKNQLQSQLNLANKHLSRLIESREVTHSDDSHLDLKISELERNNYNLINENASLSTKVSDYEYKNEHLQSQINCFQIEINDFKDLVKIRDACISKLKDKISSQYIEIQNHIHNNNALSTKLVSIQSDLIQNKKSESWFREQLRASQEQKKQLLEQLAEQQIISASHNNQFHELNVELNKYKNKYEQINLELLKLQEQYQRNVSKYQHNNIPLKMPTSQNTSEQESQNIYRQYDLTIKELTDQLKIINNTVTEYQDTIEEANKENSKVTAQCIKFQKILEEKESHIELLENQIKNLNKQLSENNSIVLNLNQELLKIREECGKLKIEISARNQEKEDVEYTIAFIRDQFAKLKVNYEKLKLELHQKNKQLLQIESEKQQLFMNNNWTICELEKMKEKDTVNNKLKEDLKIVEKEKTVVINNMDQEIEELKASLLSKDEECKNQTNALLNKIENYEEITIKYKTSLSELHNEVNCLNVQISNQQQQINNFVQTIRKLENEVAKKSCEIVHMKTEYLNLERTFSSKIEEITHERNCIGSENLKLKEDLAKMLSGNSKFLLKCGVDELGIENIIKILNQIYTLYHKKDESCDDINLDLNTVCLQSLLSVVESSQENNNAIYQKGDKEEHNEVPETNDEIHKNNRSEELIPIETAKSKMKSNGVLDISGVCCCQHDIVEFKKLQALIQVKEMEKKQIQSRNEVYNRTLLRKVKEHMKGRNATEKLNNKLQNLCNTLSQEVHLQKIQLSAKESEAELLKTQLENQRLHIDTLNQTNLLLEQNASEHQDCEKCLEYECKIQKYDLLEERMVHSNQDLGILRDELASKEEMMNELKSKIHKFHLLESKFSSEKDSLLRKLEEKESQLNELQEEITVLKSKLHYKGAEISNLLSEKEEQKNRAEQIALEFERFQTLAQKYEEDIDFLRKEIEGMNLDLSHKSEEIRQLRLQKDQLEDEWAQKTQDSQGLIASLNSEMQSNLGELDSLRNEKFFLQRLCNDLKSSLKSNLDQNLVLKNQISTLSREQEFNSLPNILPSLCVPNKLDEDHINTLLLKNKMPLTPLVDIQECLNSLKQEVLTLRKQVEKDTSSKWNYQTSLVDY